MRTALLLLASSLAFASVSPSSCTFNMQAGGPGPYSCKIIVTNGGAWSAAVGGGANYRFSNSTGGSVTGGTGNTTVWLQATTAVNSLSAGTTTDNTNAVIDGTTINITLNVYAAPTIPTFYNRNGTADSALGCTKENASFWFYGVCAVSNQRPGGTFSFPSLGSSYTDALFGTSVCALSAYPIAYPNLRVFSSDNRYLITASGDGVATTPGIYETTCTGTKAYNDPRTVNSTYIDCQFSTLHATYIYCLYDSGGFAGSRSIYRVRLDGAGGLIDDGAIWTAAVGCNITMGATNPIWSGDLLGVICDDVSKLYVVNLESATSINIDLSGISPTIDGPATTDIDYIWGPMYSAAADRYYIKVGVLNQTYNASRMFYYNTGAGSISYDQMFFRGYDLPTSSSMDADCTVAIGTTGCNQGGHSTGYHVSGEPYISAPGGVEAPNYVQFGASMMLSAGIPAMSKSKTAGGGMVQAGQLTDYCSGALSAPYIVCANTRPETANAYYVTSLSTGTPTTTLTFSPDPGWSAAQVVLCGGFAGITGLSTGANVLTVVSSLGSAQYTFTVSTSGSYTANDAACTADTTPSSYNAQEIQVMRMNADGVESTYRIAQHRSVGFYNVDYYPYISRPNISNDGRYITFSSNSGVPRGPVYQLILENPLFGSSGPKINGAARTTGAARE